MAAIHPSKEPSFLGARFITIASRIRPPPSVAPPGRAPEGGRCEARAVPGDAPSAIQHLHRGRRGRPPPSGNSYSDSDDTADAVEADTGQLVSTAPMSGATPQKGTPTSSPQSTATAPGVSVVMFSSGSTWRDGVSCPVMACQPARLT